MTDAGQPAMSAEHFALAFVAALNPKLLATDLLLIENRQPRATFLCVLLGGLTVELTIGLLDVLVFPRPAAHGLHRPDPGRLPGSQRPETADLVARQGKARTEAYGDDG
jgi:hypothetical protein